MKILIIGSGGREHAIAWKLADNSQKLKAIKDKYTFTMSTTDFGYSFSVVTRDGGMSDLADRETTLKIAGEVDIFKSFLENYKSQDEKDS